MITAAALELLGYCIASAYVLVPALLLLLCALLARFHVRLGLEEPSDPIASQRDDYAVCATAALRAHIYWSEPSHYDAAKATAALLIAQHYKAQADRYHRVLLALTT